MSRGFEGPLVGRRSAKKLQREQRKLRKAIFNYFAKIILLDVVNQLPQEHTNIASMRFTIIYTGN